MKALGFLLLVMALAGCATAPSATPTGQTFTGEVWGWDAQANTVTLQHRDGLIRVKVSPDQLLGLRLHQTVTVRGERLPSEIEQRVLPPGLLVARGTAAEIETTGTVKAIDPAGLVSIDSARGLQTVWIGTPGARPFEAAQAVRLRVRIQPLDVVPPKDGDQQRVAEPAASVGTEPGEYAAVRGRITAVDPAGRLTVESPRGPVTVAAPAGVSYQVGEWAEVHTSVHPTR